MQSSLRATALLPNSRRASHKSECITALLMLRMAASSEDAVASAAAAKWRRAAAAAALIASLASCHLSIADRPPPVQARATYVGAYPA